MLKYALLLAVVLAMFPATRRVLRALWKAAGLAWRPTGGLLAVAFLVAAAVLAFREDWWAAAALVVIAAGLLLAARRRARAKVVPASRMGMSPAEARAILGLPDDARPDAAEAAYRRLIRMAHPDRGGTAGLAAQLNAARAVLRRA